MSRSRSLIALLCVCLLSAGPAFSLDEEGQLELARHLATLEPYSGVTEYLRFLYLFPDSPLVGLAKEELGCVFERRGMGAHARRWWRSALEDCLNPIPLEFRIADSFLHDGDTLSARTIFGELREKKLEEAESGYLRCLMREYRWGEAFEEAESLAEKREDWKPLSLKLKAAEKIDYRYPERAAIFSSYLPGAGQVYAGQVSSGLGSLLLNGGGLFLTLSRLSKGDWLGSLAFLSLTSRFYFGGIENAREFSTERNEELDHRFLEEAEGMLPPLISPGSPRRWPG